MAGNTIRGRTLIGDRAQPGVRVLALDPRARRVPPIDRSDAAGNYALDVPDTTADVVLLARFRGPAVGAVHRRIASRPAEHANLTMHDYFPLELELSGDVPETVLVTMLPDAVPDWPETAASMWTYRLDHNRNESFAVWSMTGRTALLAVQPGTWRLSAWQREGRAREATSSTRSWYVSRAELVDGAELDVAATGIVLRVSGPLHVRLHMTVMTHQIGSCGSGRSLGQVATPKRRRPCAVYRWFKGGGTAEFDEGRMPLLRRPCRRSSRSCVASWRTTGAVTRG